MMTQLPALPGTNPDTPAGEALDGLVDAYGVVAVQAMVRFMTRNQNGPAINEWLVIAAGTAVRDFEVANKVSYGIARRAIADQWGYRGGSLPNFNKLADLGYFKVTGQEPDRPRAGRTRATDA